jgi:hypothetical protein
MTRQCWIVFCLLALTRNLGAQEPAEEVVHVTIHPAAAPVPALKYQFMPEYRDQNPGNALIHYARAIEMEPKMPGPDDKFWKWSEMPARDLPREEVRDFLRPYRNVFRELELAERCDHCDWQVREIIRTDTFGALFPDIQYLRKFANLLRLRSGLEIAEGRFPDAVRTLRTGFAMARHANQAPTLIAALVGTAIAQVMTDQVIELVQIPGPANVYWALTDLPRPFIDLHTAMQCERLMVNGLFPRQDAGINLRTAPLSKQQLQELIDRMEANDIINGRSGGLRLALIAIAAKGYPEAKQFVLSQGLAPETVEAMPRLQVVLLFALAEYDRLFDEMVKWQREPYWVARPGLEKAVQEVKKEKVKAGELSRLPLAALLMPATEKVVSATARVDRKIAALRCIEAIRLYAASHDGKLPATLAEIKEVPIPIDPVNGKDFAYKMEDDKAMLFAPPPAGERPYTGNYLKYELTLAK